MTTVVLGTISLDRMAGGLEKNFVLLANHLAGVGHDVHLVTFDLPGATAFFDLDTRVRWHQVGRTRPHTPVRFSERIALIRRIRNVIRETGAAVVICFHHGILFRFWMATMGSGAELICSERNSLRLYEHVQQTRKWSINFALLAMARRITVQFPAYVEAYPRWLRRRIRVIPNPIEPVATTASPGVPSQSGRYVLVCVGRLCWQKNQTGLLQAFSRIARSHPLWDLRLIGDGVDRPVLERMVAELELGDRVFLTGNSSRVADHLVQSHLFCLPSRWEGFPNALAEAMASGLPAVAFRDCAGASDLLRDGVTGLLTDADALPRTLSELMDSPERRIAMGAAAAAVAASYSPERSFGRWQALFDELSVPR